MFNRSVVVLLLTSGLAGPAFAAEPDMKDERGEVSSESGAGMSFHRASFRWRRAPTGETMIR